MKGVMCLFRVLHTMRHCDGAAVEARLGPTTAKRNGEESPVNKSFSQWTPSGHAAIRFSQDSPAVHLFTPGEYLYLHIRDAQDETLVGGPASGALRTWWELYDLSVRPDQFRVHLGGMYEPNTTAFGSRGWSRDELQFDCTNLACWPFFSFEPLERGEARRYVIDWARAE